MEEEFKDIGAELKQSKFKDEYQKVILNLIVTANQLYSANNRFLKNFGISPEQYNVLRILRGQYPNPSSILLIQDRMMDKMSNSSRLVDKLELKGLLIRRTCEQDRRQVEVTITENGKKLLEQIGDPLQQMEQLKSLVNESELELLNKVLDKIRHISKITSL